MAPEKPKKATKQPAEWVEPIEIATKAMYSVLLGQLSAEQRETLGRYHALTYGHCRRDEVGNKRKGMAVAGQLAKMGASPQFYDYKVSNYLALADEYHKAIMGAPWFTPWDVKALAPTEDLARWRIEK